MSISIYNYTSNQNQTITQNTATQQNQTIFEKVISQSKPLKIVEYVIRNQKLKKTSILNRATFKLASINNLTRKRQKLRKKKDTTPATTMLNNKMQHNRFNNANSHKHQYNHQQHQQHPQQSSYLNHFNQSATNLQQLPTQQPGLFQFNSLNFNNKHQPQLHPHQQQHPQQQQQTFKRGFKSIKSKSGIKIGNRSCNQKFSFKPEPSPSQQLTSVPVSSNLSSNTNFTNIMSASFGVNPGVAQAAAAACATLAQLLRSELTINLAKDQPRLVISGTTRSTQQPQFQQQQTPQQFLNYNNNQFNKLSLGGGGQQQQQPNRFKHFKSGNFSNNTSTVSTMPQSASITIPVKQQQSQPQLIGGKNKTAPFNTTQYIMHDYTKRRSAKKDQECPSDDFNDDWNNALKAAAAETEAPIVDDTIGQAVDSTTPSSSSNNFNFFNLNLNKLKAAESSNNNSDELSDTAAAAATAASALSPKQQPSSTTTDESNLVEIGRKFSRSVRNLYNTYKNNSTSNIEMKDENDDDEQNDENDVSAEALFSCSV
jgi:hypothetical protein